MAIPSFQAFMRPVLVELADGQVHHRMDVLPKAVAAMNLTEEELNETLRGGNNRARNRAYWAGTYLVQAGAVIRPRRGYLQITDLGRELLKQHPEAISQADLEKYEGMQDWLRRSKDAAHERRHSNNSATNIGQFDEDSNASPLEKLIESVEELDRHTATDLVQRLREQEPVFLERAVLTLLHAMGYGGSLADGEHLGQSHDGGIDGVIRQDALGLERIYVQAKRYGHGNNVGGPAMREFIGALAGMGAAGGVFITTSSYTNEALKAAEKVSPRVILIDGKELGKLMVEYQVGVTVTQTLKVTEVDENFFDDL